MAEHIKIEWPPAQQRAARMALCKRLRATGMQSDDPCDGDIVQCSCCQRTIEAIAKAVVGGTEQTAGSVGNHYQPHRRISPPDIEP